MSTTTTNPYSNDLNTEERSELLYVYKSFGCQMIASAYEILQTWAQPYTQYNKNQQLQLLEENHEDIDLYNLYLFFIPCEGFPAGIDTIIKRFELDIDSKEIRKKVQPLLKYSFMEANRYRTLLKLEKIPKPI